MPTPKLSFLQFAFILFMSVGLLNHVIMIPVLLEVARRDAWISVLLSAVLFLPASFMISYILRRSGTEQPLLTWLASRYGKWLRAFIASVIALLLFASAYVTGKDMTTWIKASFLPQTPYAVISFSFIALTYYLASQGIRSIAYSTAILLPLVILFGEFVMTFNFPQKDYSSLLPVFEYGPMPMWYGVLYVGTGMLEAIFILFLNQYLDKPVKRWNVIVLGLLIAGMAIGPIMGALAEFGPTEGSLLRFPAFEEWRLVKIGNYIEHVDFLSIFQWLSGSFIRIGLFLYLISEVFGKGKRWITGIAAGLLAACISINISDHVFLYWLKNYYFPVLFCSLLAVLLLIYALVLITPRNGGRKTNAPRRDT